MKEIDFFADDKDKEENKEEDKEYKEDKKEENKEVVEETKETEKKTLRGKPVSKKQKSKVGAPLESNKKGKKEKKE